MKDVSALSKDELQVYAESGEDFPAVTLDLRKGIESLRKQVLDLQPKENTTSEGDLFTKDEPTTAATHIKNKTTGNIFLHTKALSDHLGDDGAMCDSEGNLV